jgi:four helix bundle protein
MVNNLRTAGILPEPVPLPGLDGRVDQFDHERLDVYRAAIEFVAAANSVAEKLPRGRSYLVDQLQRAAASIPLNIAEGAGEYSSKEKARFYRIARRSATECAAILDVCESLELVKPKELANPRELLMRIVAMLVGLVKRK